MSKKNSQKYLCANCNFTQSQWLGRCPSCQEWNTFEQESVCKQNTCINKKEIKFYKVGDTETEDCYRFCSGVTEFDRVLGGGLVAGSLTLIGGEPGIGKSTLLIQILGKIAKIFPNEKILYISGEESVKQVAERASRLDIRSENLLLAHETKWQNIEKILTKLKPKIFVIDSIQTTTSSEVASSPGSIQQVREVTYELMNHAKAYNVATLAIGHITKEGSIAGPKILEHMVDTVVYFEGEKLGQYRILRAMKNRFGNTNEIGLFEMSEVGLVEVVNPSEYFIEEEVAEPKGKALACIMEGTRPLFVEVQSLLLDKNISTGKKIANGIDGNRLSMLLAVVQNLESSLMFRDTYVNVAGGMKLSSRDSDLAIVASILNERNQFDNRSVFIGEVGLNGEVRSVPRIETRLREIAQLNYNKLYTSKRVCRDYASKYPKIKFVGLKNVSEMIKEL